MTAWRDPDPDDGTDVPSPCINVCMVHPEERLCTGCLRTLEEIASWWRLTNEEKRAVIATLPERQIRLGRRRGGRAGKLSRSKL